MTRSLYGDGDTTSAPSSLSLEEKVNRLLSDSTMIKSELSTTKLQMKSDNGHLQSEIEHLSQGLTIQMKSLTDTLAAQMNAVNAQIAVLNANMESRMDRFENRFLSRMLFATFGVAVIGVGGAVTAAVLRYPNPVVQTAEAPAVKQL